MLRKILAVCLMCCAVVALLPVPVGAISDAQKDTIVTYCDAIRKDLETIRHNDSRARVYLGRYYETIFTKFIIPLNVRLVENNLSTNKLIDNQNNYKKTRENFIIDFIEYQKKLDSLVETDCKNHADEFYNKLVSVRQKREIVEKDVQKMKALITEHVSLVEGVKGSL